MDSGNYRSAFRPAWSPWGFCHLTPYKWSMNANFIKNVKGNTNVFPFSFIFVSEK